MGACQLATASEHFGGKGHKFPSVCAWICQRCVFHVHAKKELMKSIMFPSVSHRKTESCLVCLLYGGQEVPKLDKAKMTQSSITINLSTQKMSWDLLICVFSFDFHHSVHLACLYFRETSNSNCSHVLLLCYPFCRAVPSKGRNSSPKPTPLQFF